MYRPEIEENQKNLEILWNFYSQATTDELKMTHLYKSYILYLKIEKYLS